LSFRVEDILNLFSFSDSFRRLKDYTSDALDMLYKDVNKLLNIGKSTFDNTLDLDKFELQFASLDSPRGLPGVGKRARIAMDFLSNYA
jgi:hypothetical protein